MKTVTIKRVIREFPNYELGDDMVIIDPLNTDELIREIKKIKEETGSIEIVDVTRGFTRGKIFKVGDHINRTGSNPLIGRQKQLGIDFPDLSNLYQDRDSVVTDCLGNRFDSGEFEYPSTWLCHVSIAARAVGIETIRGKLISL